MAHQPSAEQLSLIKPSFLDAEEDMATTVKLTLSQGLNDEGVLSFRLPADPDRHTDLNSIFLRLELLIKKRNGNDLNLSPPAAVADPPEDKVCMEAGGMHSLFKSCDVFLNEHHASSMVAYPYTTALSRYLGSTNEMRSVWGTFDHTYDWQLDKSNLESGTFPDWMQQRRNSEAASHLQTGRLFSDILMSSRQLLPPGVSLRIDLRRAPDHFSLVSNVVPTGNRAYKVWINYAMLYVKRLKLRPSLAAPLVNPCVSKASEEQYLTYNRLETFSMAIPEGSRVFKWLDCLNGAPLPNRVYVAFVAQASVHGTLTRAGTYLENLRLSSLNFKLNGRDLLVEPILTHVNKNAAGATVPGTSDLTRGYFTLLEVFNQVADQTMPVRHSYTNYVRGHTIFAVELGKCGEKAGTSGSLDLEVLGAQTLSQ